MYEIIIEDNITDLKNKVNLYMKDGWKLSGGMSVIHNGSFLSFTQVVYK